MTNNGTSIICNVELGCWFGYYAMVVVELTKYLL